MIDITLLREHPEKIKEAMIAKRGKPELVDAFVAVDARWRTAQSELDALRQEQNKISAARDIEAGKKNKELIRTKEQELVALEKEREALWVQMPTIPSPDTPIGRDESENVEVFRFGEAPKFDFVPKDHIQLGKDLDILDLERGAKVGGYRGYYLKNEGAQLAMALMMHAVQKMVKKGYKLMIPPTLVKEFALFGSGYFKGLEYDPEVDEIYQVATSDKEATGEISRDKKFLIGTAEPALLAYYAGEVLEEKDLPIKLCGFSQCYRSEIGSYGKDTKGIYRVHEFMKVEQVVIARADIEESDKLQQEMVSITKELHEDLELPYRVIQICTGDLGMGKYKQFDYEMWLPVTNRWAETGSASNFLDWQSRRLNVKYKTAGGDRKHVYMLNNTAMPTPRPLIAILENFQTKDGRVRIPQVLQKYIGKDII